LEFITLEKVSVHPQMGVPQMYFDQINVIVKHHLEMQEDSKIVLTSDYDEDSNLDESNEETNWKATIRKLGNEASK